MSITPASIARIALAIAAIPLISALIAFLCTFCVFAFLLSLIVAWLNESDHKVNWALLTSAWSMTKTVVTQVFTWVKAPAELGKVWGWIESEASAFKSVVD